MKVVIATNNAGKVREFKQLLAPLGYDAVSQSEAGIDLDVEETGDTFEANARLKAAAVYELVKDRDVAVIADDSGLVVDFLNGEPGVRSARYADTDKERMAKILVKLDGVPAAQRTARFVCCICFTDKNGTTCYNGTCEGYIGCDMSGSNGFGYDPIFVVGEWGAKTMAELTDDEKNAVSHRGNALRLLVADLAAREAVT